MMYFETLMVYFNFSVRSVPDISALTVLHNVGLCLLICVPFFVGLILNLFIYKANKM